MTLKIRPARLEDAARIAEFNIRLAQETEDKSLDLQRVRPGVEALLVQGERGRYFVAELGGAIVGQLMITYEWSDWRNGVFWWIQSVYVVPEARRTGIFAALYAHIKALAGAEQDVCGIRLYVENQNQRAQQTYEKVGMSKTSYQIMEVDFITKVSANA
jgi:ribosomal protein S18 acetylase RimI-like enzyme